jgi:hypothetical protein
MSGIARKALAVTVALALVAGVAHASESWSASKPWWCYDLANACGLWSSDVRTLARLIRHASGLPLVEE